MKTTIDIAGPLFEEARKLAERSNTSFKSVVETSLRQYIAQQKKSPRRFKLEDCSFGGNGLQAGMREGDWRQVRDMIYEGRGA